MGGIVCQRILIKLLPNFLLIFFTNTNIASNDFTHAQNYILISTFLTGWPCSARKTFTTIVEVIS